MRYTLEEATKKAVLRNHDVKKIIRVLMDWDTDLTAIELAKAFRLKKVTIYKFATRYGLQYRRFGFR